MQKNSRPGHLYRPHPGEVLKRRYIDKSPLTQHEIAVRLGINTNQLSCFINCNCDLTLELAKKLELVSGISSAAWMNYKIAYDIYKAADLSN
ncbi:HigA family addiction module antitoxin [Alteromonas sp. CYL-A6]|uniref:HigA family addiction module antitoxin n=1 Tax=Alteromonas nitratireducens TaxID=3390813 RepID=UPI0034C3FC25